MIHLFQTPILVHSESDNVIFFKRHIRFNAACLLCHSIVHHVKILQIFEIVLIFVFNYWIYSSSILSSSLHHHHSELNRLQQIDYFTTLQEIRTKWNLFKKSNKLIEQMAKINSIKIKYKKFLNISHFFLNSRKNIVIL